MKLKGKSKIELFNAKTGGCVARIEQPNIITNALRNIGRILPLQMAYGADVSYARQYAGILPAYTKGLGGVILYDTEIPEDESTTFIPEGVCSTGHAGGGYSGANPMRGTYNDNESFYIYENDNIIGRRNVWDFATDKANGVHKCLGLTSVLGGNAGFDLGPDNDRMTEAIPEVPCSLYDVSDIVNRILPYPYTDYYPIGEVRDNEFCSMRINNVSPFGLNFFYNKVMNYKHFLPTDQFTSTNTTLTSFPTIPLPAAIEFQGAYQWYLRGVSAEEPNVLALAWVTNATTVRRLVIDVGSPSILTNDAITLVGTPPELQTSNDVNYQNIALLNGNKLYVRVYSASGYVWAYYTISGQTAMFNGIIAVSDTVRFPFVIHGKLFLDNYNKSVWFDGEKYGRCWLGSSGNSGRVRCGFRRETELPMILTAPESYWYYRGSVHRLNNYLGTINNLATPVLKTTALSMKVTYELYLAN